MQFRTDGYRKLGQALGNIPSALSAIVEGWWKMIAGTAGTAGGMAGGVLGFVGNVFNTGAKMTGAVVGGASKAAERFPVFTSIVAAVAAFAGIKSWVRRRNARNEMQELRTTNNVMQARLMNDELEKGMGATAPQQQTTTGMPDINPEARAIHVASLRRHGKPLQRKKISRPYRDWA